MAEEYNTVPLGGVGEEYSRLIALALMTRATTLAPGHPFKLAIEFKEGNKFDDVAFYDEALDEWWLIQAKHSIKPTDLSWEELFRATDDDFTLGKYFMSYVAIRQQRQGQSVRLFLFSNRALNATAVKVEVMKVDRMLQFHGGEHFRLVVGPKEIDAIKRYAYGAISDALVKLFVGGDGRTIQGLMRYHAKLLSRVLSREGARLKFSERFLAGNEECEFYDFLKRAFGERDMSTVSVNAPRKCPDLWSGSVEEAPDVSDATVKQFFNDLVLSCPQPNAKKLAEEIQKDWIRWMKSWIRPDVFCKLTASQLEAPFHTFWKCFKEWENPYEPCDKRPFLTHDDGVRFLKIVKGELDSCVKQYGRQGYVGLDAAERYYVERFITFEKGASGRDRLLEAIRGDSSGASSHKNQISDEAFVEWLCKEWNDPKQQCFALFAEPGMGKSTLWQHLAFRVQQKYADVEVILIFLNDFREELQTCSENMNLENVVKILQGVISDRSIAALKDSQQKVVIFMDAFDELRDSSQQTFLNLINTLTEHKSNSKILISSRKRCREELKANLLNLETLNVAPFDAANRSDFLRCFWKVEASTKLDEYSKELLDRFERDIPQGDAGFIDLPLTMRMLAEVFQDSFETFLTHPATTNPKSVLPNISISVIYLYEQFTRKSISLALNKKWKLNITEDSFGNVIDPLIEAAEVNYQLYAMEQMNFSKLIHESHRTKLEKFHESIRQGQAESILLETTSGLTRFSHQSYAEFFCAKYLFTQIETPGTIECGRLESALQVENVVRKFFLKMLDTKHLDLLQPIWGTVEVWACEANCGKLLSCTQNPDHVRVFNEQRTTLLHVAAMENSCEAMQVLLEASETIDVNVENLPHRDTPLSFACEEGHLEMVQLLVESGANVNHRPGAPSSPLNKAAQWGHLPIVEYLLENGANVNPEVGEAAEFIPLHSAAGRGRTDVVRLLLQRGALVDGVNSSQLTALQEAAHWGHCAIVEELLKWGANVNAQADSDGRTPLHYAARMGHLEVVRVLLEKGANVDLLDRKNGKSALHHAVSHGGLAVVEELLLRGANINVRDREGKLPFCYAESRNTTDVMQVLSAKMRGG